MAACFLLGSAGPAASDDFNQWTLWSHSGNKPWRVVEGHGGRRWCVKTLDLIQRRYQGGTQRTRETALIIVSGDVGRDPFGRLYFPGGLPAELRCLLDGVDLPPAGPAPKSIEERSVARGCGRSVSAVGAVRADLLDGGRGLESAV